MSHQRRRGDGFARAGRTLDQRQRSRESLADGIHLVVVQLREARHAQLRRNLSINKLILRVIAENLVEDVVRQRGLIFQEDLERLLHPVEARAFPDKLDGVLASFDVRRRLPVLDLEADLLVLRDLDDVAARLPLDLAFRVLHLELQLVAGHESDVVLVRENEVGESFFVLLVPADAHVLLRLALLELLVVVGLEPDQRLENLFVLLRVLVAQ